MKDYLIREETVCQRLCIGRATLAQWIKDGIVPPPVRKSPNKAWRSSSIDRYIERIEEIGFQQAGQR